ncbi:MAG: M20/M25/M40 family metallo-hydrolase [Desulfurococcales archaeon]|nr:M20/M25/M40 family metallo-hydrolase [Desulfurococcales archaeon]
MKILAANPVVELLSKLVEIPTVNDPSKGLKVGVDEAEKIGRLLREYGLETDLIVWEGTPSLLAVLGEGRPVTLFLAHFDVVPPGPGWSMTDPFKPLVTNGRLYGRGSADDKSNIAAITIALRDYKPREGTVIIAFTGDEEVGGANGAKRIAEMLEKEGLFPDYLVNGDGSLSRIIIRRRNAFKAKISVKNEKRVTRGSKGSKSFETIIKQRKTMHSAYFVPGVDTHAFVEASLWLRDNEVELVGVEGEWVKSNVLPRKVTLHYNVGGEGSVEVDEGLTRLVKSIIPIVRAPIPTEMYSDYGVSINPNMYEYKDGYHTVVLDIRAMLSSKDNIQVVLSQILRETLDNGKLEVTGGGGYLYTSRDARIVKIAARANASLGLNPEPIEAGGASDSRFFSPHGVEAVDYGPLGYNIHGPDEHVVIENLVKSVEFYRRLAEEIHG